MTKIMRRIKRTRKRRLFRELLSGVEAMRAHRKGRLTFRAHQVEPVLKNSPTPS